MSQKGHDELHKSWCESPQGKRWMEHNQQRVIAIAEQVRAEIEINRDCAS